MRYVVLALAVILSAVFIVFNEAAMLGAVDGLRLFASSVFPSLFPFFVCAKLISSAGVLNNTSSPKHGCFNSVLNAFKAFVVSSICGTPTGAVSANTLCGEGASPTRLSVLSAILNQMGPLFIFGSLATSMLGSPSLGVLLAVSHYLPGLVCSVAFSLLYFRREQNEYHIGSERPSVKLSPLTCLTEAISESVFAILRVGGTIVFFRVLCSTVISSGILRTSGTPVQAFIFGTIEMTNGLSLISNCAIPWRLLCSLCCFLLTFGGLCIYVQSRMLVDIRPLPYFITKFCLGAASFSVCYLFYPHVGVSEEVFFGMGEKLNSFDVASRAEGLLFMAICVLLSISASFLYASMVARKTHTRP